MITYKPTLAAISVTTVLFLIVMGASHQAENEDIQYLNVPGRSDDLPYSNLVVSGDTVFLAGAIGIDPQTGSPPPEIEDEVRLVMDGMKERLQMVDLTMDDLVSVQVFCPDLSLYDRFNAVYRTYFTDHYPARAFIGSGPLLRGGHFEIVGTAVRRN